MALFYVNIEGTLLLQKGLQSENLLIWVVTKFCALIKNNMLLNLKFLFQAFWNAQ
jgi:hypothetical protein